MRSTILILILLFSLLFVPAVLAEDVVEWYIKGQNAMTVGDYPTAVTYYNKALDLDKKYASAYAGRAAALNMLGKYTEAIASADSGLAIKSMDPVALNARAFRAFWSDGFMAIAFSAAMIASAWFPRPFRATAFPDNARA